MGCLVASSKNKTIDFFVRNIKFLIIEKYLENRYKYFDNKFSDRKIILNLETKLSTNFLKLFFARILDRNIVYKEYLQFRYELKDISLLILSNSEGFLAENIITWIKRDFPFLKIVALQHGFISWDGWFKMKLKVCINYLIYNTLAFKLFGMGFCNKHVDYYIVYNQIEKAKMVRMGVPQKNIFISSKTLKYQYFKARTNFFQKQSQDVVVFFLQPLFSSGITSINEERELVERVIFLLSKKAQVVYIKQHPFKKVHMSALPSNCFETKESISSLALKVGAAYSFFSEALLEINFFGVKTFAIYSDKLKSRKSLYENFSNIINLDIDFELVKTNKKSPQFFYEMGQSFEEILTTINLS